MKHACLSLLTSALVIAGCGGKSSKKQGQDDATPPPAETVKPAASPAAPRAAKAKLQGELPYLTGSVWKPDDEHCDPVLSDSKVFYENCTDVDVTIPMQ